MIYFNDDSVESIKYLDRLYQLLVFILLEENYDNSLSKGVLVRADNESAEKGN